MGENRQEEDQFAIVTIGNKLTVDDRGDNKHHTNINMADWNNSKSKFWEDDFEAGENTNEDIDEPGEDIPTRNTINGDEWWLKFHG